MPEYVAVFTFNVDPLASVKFVEIVWRIEPGSNVPDVNTRFVGVNAAVAVAVFPPPTLICKVPKLDAPICGAAPVKFAVPVAVNVPPLFDQTAAPVPVTVIVLPLSENVPAVCKNFAQVRSSLADREVDPLLE